MGFTEGIACLRSRLSPPLQLSTSSQSIKGTTKSSPRGKPAAPRACLIETWKLPPQRSGAPEEQETFLQASVEDLYLRPVGWLSESLRGLHAICT